jgi:mono/diheme cytochrome c family protein
MRHLLANVLTYAIATLLFLGAALFAWARSSQLTLSDEATLLARYEPAPAHEFDWQALGARSYARNCAACHGSDGSGWDQYPPVSHAVALAAQPGGREYLVDVHLHGLTSRRFGAPMPPMRHLRDVELAAVLNHVLTAFGPGTGDPSLLYGPDDIASRRGTHDSPAGVNRRRPLD